jgi:hypothetical protein
MTAAIAAPIERRHRMQWLDDVDGIAGIGFHQNSSARWRQEGSRRGISMGVCQDRWRF